MGHKPWSEIRDARPDTAERRAQYEASRQEALDEIAAYARANGTVPLDDVITAFGYTRAELEADNASESESD